MYIKINPRGILVIYHLPGTHNLCQGFFFLINFYSVNTTIASFSEKGDQNEFWKKEIKNSFFKNSEKFDGLRKFSNFLLVNVSSPQIHYTLTDQIQLLLKIYEF
ncbi:unnamed protein product [Rhizophagus irregularis]|nr:unnamed protein product [Rhizophagus irregularis]